MQAIKNSSKYIETTGVCIPSLDRTISIVGQIEGLDKPLFEALKKMHRIYGYRLIYLNNSYYLVTEYPFTSSEGSRNPLYLIYAKLSVDSIRKYIQSFLITGSDRFILRDNDQNYIISNETDRQILEQLYQMSDSADYILPNKAFMTLLEGSASG